MSETKKYTSHSGGCRGADMFWETEGLKYGVASVAYSFYNHVQYGYNQKILSTNELKEGWDNVMIAEKTLRRNFTITQSFYVRNLVSRNWFQVKNAEAVFAVSTFLNNAKTQVSGGTGWAVQMGIDNNKPIFFFDQLICKWFEYNYAQQKFIEFDGIPTLTENFAGVGSAKLNKDGEKAISEIYKLNFKDE